MAVLCHERLPQFPETMGTTDRGLLSLHPCFYYCRYCIWPFYEARLVPSTVCSMLSILTSSFVCKLCVVSLRHTQINCLGFSFLRLGTKYAAVCWTDGCSFSAILMLLQLGVNLWMPWFAFSYSCAVLDHWFSHGFISQKAVLSRKTRKIVAPHPRLLCPLEQKESWA